MSNSGRAWNAPSGVRPDDYEAATAELERLEGRDANRTRLDKEVVIARAERNKGRR